MVEGKVLHDGNLGVAFLFESNAVMKTGVKFPDHPTAPAVRPLGSQKIAYWGDDNLFPQNVKKLADLTFIPGVIAMQVRALYGSLEYGVEVFDPATKKYVFTPSENPDVDDFLKKTNVKRYLIEAASDFYWFGNIFPELILTNDRSKIASISVQEAMFSRFEKQNPKTGAIENCYINANWDNGGKEDDPNTTVIPVIDPYYDAVGSLQARKDGFKYIFPLSFPTPGSTFYQVAPWDSVRKSGWLEIASLIPKWKKALMTNQLSIKYHIEVPDYYWSWKYKDWENKTDAQRKTIVENELKNFNAFFSSPDNSGRSFMTQSKFDSERNIQYPGWKITALDDKLGDGKYIDDSNEASSQLLFALGVDGTLIGTTPGKSMGAGSGSDKRVAYNMYMQLRQADEDILFEPLHFIRDYNGWDPKLKFRFRRRDIVTADNGTSTKPVA